MSSQSYAGLGWTIATMLGTVLVLGLMIGIPAVIGEEDRDRGLNAYIGNDGRLLVENRY